MDQFNLYKDIRPGPAGEIYLGIVGPVRTGKSTFIKRFMDMMVIPKFQMYIAGNKPKDELPQSSGGTVIMTSEPKFIPKDSGGNSVDDQVKVKIRCIDCVGFMVEEPPAMRKKRGGRADGDDTWFNEPVPFTRGGNRHSKSNSGTCDHWAGGDHRRKFWGYSKKSLCTSGGKGCRGN